MQVLLHILLIFQFINNTAVVQRARLVPQPEVKHPFFLLLNLSSGLNLSSPIFTTSSSLTFCTTYKHRPNPNLYGNRQLNKKEEEKRKKETEMSNVMERNQIQFISNEGCGWSISLRTRVIHCNLNKDRHVVKRTDGLTWHDKVKSLVRYKFRQR